MLDLVPLAGPGREVAHGEGQAGAVGQLLQFPFPQAYAGPLLSKASAVMSNERARR